MLSFTFTFSFTINLVTNTLSSPERETITEHVIVYDKIHTVLFELFAEISIKSLFTTNIEKQMQNMGYIQNNTDE